MQNFSSDLPQNLPEWFCMDKDAGMLDTEIHEKIRIEVYNEIINQQCDLSLWTEEFIDEVADMYFKHFDKMYNDFCMKQLSSYMSRNKMLNAFDSSAMVNKPMISDEQMGFKPQKPNS